jgi:large subunit ribosomal protein L21
MSKSKSKILNPKAWYLVGAGAVALGLDGARRLFRRRQRDAAQAESDMAQRAASPPPQSVSPPAPAQPAPAATTRAATAKSAKAKDDLTEIKGIGPTFAGRLAEAGITTFADLAKASPDHLREVTNATAVASPEEWIEEARGK